MSRASAHVDLNDVQIDVWNLFQLLEATVDILREMPYERDGKRDDELDRVSALAHIARDRARDIERAIRTNFYAIQRGQAKTDAAV